MTSLDGSIAGWTILLTVWINGARILSGKMDRSAGQLVSDENFSTGGSVGL